MERGTVLEWYVQPGDVVGRGSVVALVSTEKADVDVEIWQKGTIAEFLVEVGEEVPVGTPLLRLGSVDEATTEPEPTIEPEPTLEPEPVLEETAEAAGSARTGLPPTPEGGQRIAASPRARSVAAARGVDLATVTGSGPDGAILERDLLAASAGIEATAQVHTGPGAGDGKAADRQAAMRQAIADRMAKANAEIPHYHLELDLDLGPTLSWLEEHNRPLDVADRVLPAALFLKATAAAALAVPELNGSWIDSRYQPAKGSDVAVVISLRKGGLVTPKISDGANKTVDEVMADLKELVAGARRGSLRSSWMSGAGITVTNLGDNGVDRVNGVIFPPQVALVGFGQIAERPCVVEGAVVPRPMVTVSLAADHRATDGSTGSRFLRALAEHLTPAKLETDQPEHPEQP